MNKKPWIICGIVVLVCLAVVVFVLLRSGVDGFDKALQKAGISNENVFVYDLVSYDIDGRFCKAIQSTTTDTGAPVLAVVSQKEDGSWEVTMKQEVSGNRANVAWLGDWQHRVYEAYPSVMRSTDCPKYYFYYGNDARRRIDLENSDVPPNVAVSVEQQNNEYWISMVFYGNNANKGFDIIDFLEERRFIHQG
jgi:hypothetical protein